MQQNQQLLLYMSKTTADAFALFTLSFDKATEDSACLHLQVEQQQQILTRKQEQAAAARELLTQLKATPVDDQSTVRMEQLILQQNEALYLSRVLQASGR